ncbi:hypothetical protein [Okeania sp.]|uniref:hypothetical protein n=1 Tax=Okeania sp. TaxID=3100323 RepID=UPI002B4B8626|nr:hypothetical protein [Okeania sp.]MEB3342619.1 hypothetical protein [Okeania sp.]
MSNLRSQLSRIANLMLLPTTFILAVGFNNSAIAQSQLYSRDGELKVQQLRSDQSACATGKSSDSYYVKNGATGLLYPSRCGRNGSETAF